MSDPSSLPRRDFIKLALVGSAGVAAAACSPHGRELAPLLVPEEQLLVETDSPFLSPPGAPRSRNQPEYVAITARWAAALRGVGEDALGDALVTAYDATFPRARPR